MIEIQNPSEAFLEENGPILLLAGPGTGKTYQLSHRIKYLIQTKNVSPDEVTVITFTTESAKHMRDELSKEVFGFPKDQHPKTIKTMHSLANAIIGANTSYFGLNENYGVLTDNFAQDVLFKDACNIAGYKRNDFKKTKICRGQGNCEIDGNEQKCQICKIYVQLVRKCSLIDYDDQIFLACQILRDEEDVRNVWNAKAKYLLVDEYQDINASQFDMIKLLSESNRAGLFAVGDDDQSIYSFRGGSPAYIQNFENHFGPASKIGRLSKSWRCPEFILQSAKEVIKKYYKESVQKPESTFRQDIKLKHNKIFVVDVPSSKYEANAISKIAQSKYKEKTVCIIIPNGQYFPTLKYALKNYKLPFKYKIKPNDDGLNRFILLKDWISNRNNSLLFRVILELIISYNDSLTSKFPSAVSGIKEKRNLFSKHISSLWAKVDETKSLYDIVFTEAFSEELLTIIKELKSDLTKLIDLVENEGNKRKSLPEFLEKVGLFLAPGNNPNKLINEIIEWNSELNNNSNDGPFNPIEIYNMPSSKGLEGEIIIIIGLSHGIFPHPKSDIEEQGRLFYVAMTRAKEELYIFNARTRPGSVTFTGESYQLTKSEFLDCIPKEYREDIYRRSKK